MDHSDGFPPASPVAPLPPFFLSLCKWDRQGSDGLFYLNLPNKTSNHFKNSLWALSRLLRHKSHTLRSGESLDERKVLLHNTFTTALAIAVLSGPGVNWNKDNPNFVYPRQRVRLWPAAKPTLRVAWSYCEHMKQTRILHHTWMAEEGADSKSNASFWMTIMYSWRV